MSQINTNRMNCSKDVEDELYKYNIDPDKHIPNNDFEDVPQFVVGGLVLWSIFNGILLTSFYKKFIFWAFLLGSFVFISVVLLLFFTLLFLDYRFQHKKIVISVLIFNIWIILLTIFCFSKFKVRIIWGLIGAFTFSLDMAMILHTRNSGLSLILFVWAFEEFYNIKSKFFKHLMKRIVYFSLGLYYSVASFLITYNIYVEKSEYNLDDNLVYEIISMIIQGITSLLLVKYYMFYPTKMGFLFGILLQTSQHKGKVTNNIKSILKKMKNKDTLKKYSMSTASPYTLQYGLENEIIRNYKIFSINKTWIQLIEDIRIPVGICVSIGSFIYSMVYNVDIDKATRMCVTASFESGYLDMINSLKLHALPLFRIVFDSLNVSLLAATPFLIITIIKKNATIIVLTQIGSVTLLIFLLVFWLLNFTMSITNGFSTALIYRFIEDPEDISYSIKYGKKLKKYMEIMHKKEIG